MSTPRTNYGFLHHVARAALWLAPVLFVAAAVAVLTPVVLDLQDNFWRYYSDDDTIRRDSLDARARQTLWSHPDAWSGPVAARPIEGGPHFTADDGHAIVAVRVPERGDLDLFLTDWSGRAWSAPVALEGVNSATNEFEGVLSPDGQYLFFVSDREGGAGAADIWMARRSVSNTWEVVAPFGAGVNTPADERGLSVAADGKTLYFASNRGGGAGGYDLYRARLAWPGTNDAPAGQTSAVPVVASSVEQLVAACSEADDVEPALSPSGDILYFASTRRDGQGGYDLYVSRVIRDVVGAAENASTELNGPGDERRPALRMQGFDMAYAATVGSNALQVVSVTRREVIANVDYALWESYLALLNRIKWWVVAIIVSLLALVYLIRRYRDLTNLFHKCLMASAIVHAAILFAVATWTVTKEVKDSMDAAALEMLVDNVALQDMAKEIGMRKEAMAMDQHKQVVPLPAATIPRMATVQDREPVALDAFEPATPGQGTAGGMVVPAAPLRKEQSVVEAVPVSSGQPDAPQAVVAASRELKKLTADLQVAAVDEIALEEMPAGSAAPAGSSGEVKLDTAVAQKSVAGEFKREGPAGTKAVSEALAGEAVAGPVAEAVKSVGGMVSASTAAAAARPAAPGEARTFRKPTGYDVPMEGLDVQMEVPAYGNAQGGATNATGPEAAGQGERGTFDPAGVVAAVGSSFQSGGGLAGSGIGGSSAGGKGRGMGVGGPAGSGAGVGDVVGGGGGSGAGSGNGAGVAGGTGAAATGSGGDPASAVGGVAQRASSGRPSTHPVEGESTDVVLTKLAKRGGVRAGEVRLGAPVEMEVPAEYANRSVPDLLVFNGGRPSMEVVEALGGSGETEGAIRGSLDWLTRNQEPDGRWSCEKHGGMAGHDVAATSLALLCYYGWGMKHNVDCEYFKPVKAGIVWLAAQVKPDGDIRSPGVGKAMYDQGIAGVVLCEAYGVSHDPALLAPASNVIAFIARAQNKDGGWRYLSDSQDSDLSVFGWQYMALHSARMSGIPVPSNALERAGAWIDRVSGGISGGLYGYQGRTDLNRPAMSACGMFCRQLQKVPPTEDRMKETAGFLRTRTLPGNNVDFYYMYYATLALYQHQGEVWEEWNKRMKEVLPPLQRKTGPEAGSWDPLGSAHGLAMGRCVTTAIGALSLEVYYRFLPMYGYRSAEDEARKEPAKGKTP